MRFKAWEIFSGINCDDNISSFESTVMILSAVMHQSIETPTLWVPGKGGGFDIDPSQKASISLPPEAIV